MKRHLLVLSVVLVLCACASSGSKEPKVLPIKKDASAVTALHSETSVSQTIRSVDMFKSSFKNGSPIIYIKDHRAIVSEKHSNILVSQPSGSFSLYMSDPGSKYLYFYLDLSNKTGDVLNFDITKDLNIYAVDKDGTQTLLKNFTPAQIGEQMSKGLLFPELKPESVLNDGKSVMPAPVALPDGYGVKGGVFVDRKAAYRYKVLLFINEDVYEFNYKASEAKSLYEKTLAL